MHTEASSRLRAWRTKRGLSQAEAAQMASVSQSTWNDWERGRKHPRVTQANRLARLGICPVKAWGEGTEASEAASA